MSVVLVGLPDLLGAKVVQRLVHEGDEVRMVVPGDDVERWRRLGAHPAVGDAADDDLIERAAANARTVVVGEEALDPPVTEAIISGAMRSSVERVVVRVPQPPDRLLEILRATELEFVVMATAKRPLFGKAKTRVPLSKLAEVIDAADDLSGRLRLELDLTVEESWRLLRVLPPE